LPTIIENAPKPNARFTPKMKIDKLIRSKRKTIGLQIASDATLIVRVPNSAKTDDIEKAVAKHAEWIRKKKEQTLIALEKAPVRRFIEGENLPYLGNYYEIRLTADQKIILRFDNAFYLSERYSHIAKRVFTQWFMNQAKLIISQRVTHYAFSIGLKHGRIGITNATKRWGSCSYRGNLNFAWRLVLAPIEAIDYVVVHELVHLEIKNHSKRFWIKVESIYPGYKVQRKWLRDNQRALNL
jgi:predicted metal-dependent hydrolase